MKIDWNKIHQKASVKHEKAREDAAFMMHSLMNPYAIQSVACFYPEETRNFFKTRRLLHYVEKRMNRGVR